MTPASAMLKLYRSASRLRFLSTASRTHWSIVTGVVFWDCAAAGLFIMTAKRMARTKPDAAKRLRSSIRAVCNRVYGRGRHVDPARIGYAHDHRGGHAGPPLH